MYLFCNSKNIEFAFAIYNFTILIKVAV